jgi:HSP20 family protein
MRSLIPFDGLFGDTVLDHFFDDVPTIYKDYVSVPKADIEDLKDHYEVTCDMPGYTKDEIQVTYENGILSLSAKREDTKETKDADRKFIRRERSFRRFPASVRREWRQGRGHQSQPEGWRFESRAPEIRET